MSKAFKPGDAVVLTIKDQLKGKRGSREFRGTFISLHGKSSAVVEFNGGSRVVRRRVLLDKLKNVSHE